MVGRNASGMEGKSVEISGIVWRIGCTHILNYKELFLNYKLII